MLLKIYRGDDSAVEKAKSLYNEVLDICASFKVFDLSVIDSHVYNSVQSVQLVGFVGFFVGFGQILRRKPTRVRIRILT